MAINRFNIDKNYIHIQGTPCDWHNGKIANFVYMYTYNIDISLKSVLSNLFITLVSGFKCMKMMRLCIILY